jgi:hypothetical protein
LSLGLIPGASKTPKTKTKRWRVHVRPLPLQRQLKGAIFKAQKGSSLDTESALAWSWTSHPPELWAINLCFS